MKTRIMLITLFAITLIFGCKQKQMNDKVEDIIEEASVSKLPNKSDEYFVEALSALDEQKGKEASKSLKKGIAELSKEGKEVSGLYKVNLERATEQLTQMASNLENGKSVSEQAIREAMANAEINIAHEYLTTSEVYVLEEPDNVVSNKTRKHFNRTFKNLKKEEGKMKVEVKKEGEALLKEGEKLDKELKEWEKKAKEYSKKTNEHFKQHYPHYYPYFPY